MENYEDDVDQLVLLKRAKDKDGIFDFSLYLFGVGLKKKTLEQNWFDITVTDNEEELLLKKKE